jgi:NADH:ubiquinone oxidoreductase subunit 4 (subunit M)
MTQRGGGEEPHPVFESMRISFIKKRLFLSESHLPELHPLFLAGEWRLGVDGLSLGSILLIGFITTVAAWPVNQNSMTAH